MYQRTLLAHQAVLTAGALCYVPTHTNAESSPWCSIAHCSNPAGAFLEVQVHTSRIWRVQCRTRSSIPTMINTSTAFCRPASNLQEVHSKMVHPAQLGHSLCHGCTILEYSQHRSAHESQSLASLLRSRCCSSWEPGRPPGPRAHTILGFLLNWAHTNHVGFRLNRAHTVSGFLLNRAHTILGFLLNRPHTVLGFLLNWYTEVSGRWLSALGLWICKCVHG